jgi:hypothetical protein
MRKTLPRSHNLDISARWSPSGWPGLAGGGGRNRPRWGTPALWLLILGGVGCSSGWRVAKPVSMSRLPRLEHCDPPQGRSPRTSLAIRLTPGQAGDNPSLLPALDDISAVCVNSVGGPGRPCRFCGGVTPASVLDRVAIRSDAEFTWWCHAVW